MIDQKYLNDLGITDEATVKAITDTYAADIKAEQDAAKTALDAAQTDSAGWKQKYEQLEADSKAKDYESSVDKFVQAQNMRNSVYAEHLKRQIMEQKLQFDDKGVLMGGNEAVKALRDSCPDAFLPNPDERAAAPTSGHVPQAMDGVERAFYEKNPKLAPKN